MAKNAATEAIMGLLHAKVASVMVKALDNVEAAQTAFKDALESGNEDAVMEALGNMPEVSPALLSAVTKFLADNKITCQPEDDANLGGLAERLKAKQSGKRKAVGNIVPFEPD